MLQSDFRKSAEYIAARNLTPNVAAVAASLDASESHVHVVYYVYGSPTDDDEEWRELTVGELVGAFPEIQTASSGFGAAEDVQAVERGTLVFERT